MSAVPCCRPTAPKKQHSPSKSVRAVGTKPSAIKFTGGAADTSARNDDSVYEQSVNHDRRSAGRDRDGHDVDVHVEDVRVGRAREERGSGQDGQAAHTQRYSDGVRSAEIESTGGGESQSCATFQSPPRGLRGDVEPEDKISERGVKNTFRMGLPAMGDTDVSESDARSGSGLAWMQGKEGNGLLLSAEHEANDEQAETLSLKPAPGALRPDHSFVTPALSTAESKIDSPPAQQQGAISTRGTLAEAAADNNDGEEGAGEDVDVGLPNVDIVDAEGCDDPGSATGDPGPLPEVASRRRARHGEKSCSDVGSNVREDPALGSGKKSDPPKKQGFKAVMGVVAAVVYYAVWAAVTLAIG